MKTPQLGPIGSTRLTTNYELANAFLTELNSLYERDLDDTLNFHYGNCNVNIEPIPDDAWSDPDYTLGVNQPFWKSETALRLIDEMHDLLDSLAPPYMSFCCLTGGDTYGFSPNWGELNALPHVTDPSELDALPSDTFEAVYVNDHSNTDYYAWSTNENKWKLMWSCV